MAVVDDDVVEVEAPIPKPRPVGATLRHLTHLTHIAHRSHFLDLYRGEGPLGNVASSALEDVEDVYSPR